MTSARVTAACLAVAFALAGCASSGPRPMAGAPAPAGAAPSAPSSPSTGADPSPSPAPPASPTAPGMQPGAFVGESAPVTAADLPHTWRAGCPVAPEALRLLRLSYWGFDGQPHVGAMVVNRSVAAEVISAFADLYRQRFPIRLMQPVDAYGGSDDASMAADNTSGFNCRAAVSSGPKHWSAHAYGLAIDLNPVENPYLLAGSVLPPAGSAYVTRTPYRPGMAVTGGAVVRAFAAVGWSWGGRWSNPDYQHFTKTGG